MRKIAILGGLAAIIAGIAVTGTVKETDASSHREAPYISTDPLADATDLYAFVANDAPDSVTFVANYVPFGVPSGGPNWNKFGDDVLYEINIDNDGDARDDLAYQFRFRSDINAANAFNTGTFLYNTGPVSGPNDPNQNIRQFYSVSTLTGNRGSTRQGTVVAENLQVAPARVGPKSFPNYGTVADKFNFTIGNGVKVFAGPRDDPFFIDLGGTFDLLNLGGGVDYVKGLNVMSIVIQVPKAQLTKSGVAPTGASDPNAIIGVRTTAYRQSIRVLRQLGDGGSDDGPEGTGARSGERGSISRGPWVQLSRLDLPLINEAVITLKDKDRFNGSKPANDGQFLSYVQNSHFAALLNLVLGVNVPANPRNDLVDTLLKGIEGLNRPAGVVPSSQLRLNMAIAPSATPNRLGAVGGDTAGFPNGRRLTDDITDIEIAAIAGCLQGGVFAANCTLGDGVNTNDKPFLTKFPYLALPHDYANTAD
ncbi:MAG: DUF4331 domain-containing protein [Dehalococcoidia bacterium]